jgi:hypothetical protein
MTGITETPARHGQPLHARARNGAGWLAAAMTALALLAIAAAVVSWDAQYVMVAAARHTPAIAALEAGIPDAGAAVFAALGIALALHGRRALRPRALNLACVGLSVTMNALAASPGWRDAAIWVMPAAVYALASDTLIGVVRAWVIARSRHAGQLLAADDGVTPLAVAARCLLWLLRLALAPASTLTGFRRWVITACPPAPALANEPPGLPEPEDVPARPVTHRAGPDGRPRKQDLLIALAGQRYDLRTIPLGQLASIAAGISGEVDLHAGTARRVLRAHVLALRDHHAPAGRQSA